MLQFTKNTSRFNAICSVTKTSVCGTNVKICPQDKKCLGKKWKHLPRVAIYVLHGLFVLGTRHLVRPGHSLHFYGQRLNGTGQVLDCGPEYEWIKRCY